MNAPSSNQGFDVCSLLPSWSVVNAVETKSMMQFTLVELLSWPLGGATFWEIVYILSGEGREMSKSNFVSWYKNKLARKVWKWMKPAVPGEAHLNCERFLGDSVKIQRFVNLFHEIGYIVWIFIVIGNYWLPRLGFRLWWCWQTS
jgi:hypothetical protein